MAGYFFEDGTQPLTDVEWWEFAGDGMTFHRYGELVVAQACVRMLDRHMGHRRPWKGRKLSDDEVIDLADRRLIRGVNIESLSLMGLGNY